ncbi:haloacid dehalogenase [Gloeophyllum trabeum ATCC 11539]|uniref:Haloacid dehalogenase n=1 Tax=Gloeophyllum trabeum (strain ATCC 11539 / FP-39264 / Madison 617) TaxID=670483 RepID=S7S5P8_GLOTA|nr:haloacid dehalogenase [Gloeophyllum trabeum ATCC 11539]EPQ61334.1 haloacid dehalogenase [Gloeophyllum trabeum ATCC 11539]
MHVKALLFDVFGTVVDWQSTAVRVLSESGPPSEDYTAFAQEWRKGYGTRTRQTAKDGEGTLNVDVMHRQILDEMLGSPKWAHLGKLWDEDKRAELTLLWHKLDGWPDATEGLYALKKRFIIATLSNGNVRLLVDMAKHADLPWDAVFSGELLGSYKPNPKTYLGAAHLLALEPSQIAMVAAHIEDLRAAASFGLKTIYVRRSTEDTPEDKASARSKDEGGEVDMVVDSFLEIIPALERKGGKV